MTAKEWQMFLATSVWSSLTIHSVVADLAAAEAREAKLVKALEKIEHNGCTEDAHVARAALASVKEEEK